MERKRPGEGHSLAEDGRGAGQDTERKRLSDSHSLSGDSRERDLSGYRRKATERESPTLWRRKIEGLVRTRKESD